MKVEEFQKLLIGWTQKTKNVRAFSGKWTEGGVDRIPYEVASKIGCIVLLIQDQVNKGKLCKENEELLIHNFQPLNRTDINYAWGLDIVVRPSNTDLTARIGKSQNLVIGKDGTVVNEALATAHALRELGLTEENEGEEEDQVCYGNYLNYYIGSETPHLVESDTVLYFTEEATAFRSIEFLHAGAEGCSETETKNKKEEKKEKESQCLTTEVFGQKSGAQNAMVFAYDSLRFADAHSPTGTSIPSSPLILMQSTSGDLGIDLSSHIVNKKQGLTIG